MYNIWIYGYLDVFNAEQKNFIKSKIDMFESTGNYINCVSRV